MTTTTTPPVLNIPLEQLSIASPCTASWDAMTGNERQRFCDHCSMNVYNLSGMTRGEAMDLIAKSEGRTCVRFFRRADGTILTADCPVGLRALRLKMMKGFGKVAAAITLALGGLLYGRALTDHAARNTSIDNLAPVSTANRWLDVRPQHGGELMGEMIMGDVAVPPSAIMGRMAPN